MRGIRWWYRAVSGRCRPGSALDRAVQIGGSSQIEIEVQVTAEAAMAIWRGLQTAMC